MRYGVKREESSGRKTLIIRLDSAADYGLGGVGTSSPYHKSGHGFWKGQGRSVRGPSSVSGSQGGTVSVNGS
jgi:hypothetical protein